MRKPLHLIGVVAALALLFSGCKPKPVPPSVKPAVAAAAKPAALTATNNPAAQYVSVFEDLPPAQGHDPFYPDSHRRDPTPVRNVAQPTRLQPQGELHLKGIVSSSSHRQAVINTTIMGEGEEDSVHVPDGILHVKCIRIGDDYAIVQVQGESQPKRLVLEEKHY